MFTTITYKHGITLEYEVVSSSTKYCMYIDMKQEPNGVNVHYKRRIHSFTQPHEYINNPVGIIPQNPYSYSTIQLPLTGREWGTENRGRPAPTVPTQRIVRYGRYD